MKVNVIEYGFDKETGGIYPRDFKKGVGVKYDKEKDSWHIEYKNQKPPVKHDFIHNNVLSLINYENSFIPIKIMDMKIVDIDTMGKKSETLKKLKLEIKEGEVSEESEKKEKPKIKDVKELKDLKDVVKGENIIDPNPSSRYDDFEIKKRSETKEKILRVSAIPMAIRSYYLLHLKRLASKHMSFWEKWGNVALFVIFGAIILSALFIVLDQGKVYNAEMLDHSLKVLDRIQILAVRNESVGDFVPVGEVPITTTTEKPLPLIP